MQIDLQSYIDFMLYFFQILGCSTSTQTTAKQKKMHCGDRWHLDFGHRHCIGAALRGPFHKPVLRRRVLLGLQRTLANGDVPNKLHVIYTPSYLCHTPHHTDIHLFVRGADVVETHHPRERGRGPGPDTASI